MLSIANYWTLEKLYRILSIFGHNRSRTDAEVQYVYGQMYSSAPSGCIEKYSTCHETPDETLMSLRGGEEEFSSIIMVSIMAMLCFQRCECASS